MLGVKFSNTHEEVLKETFLFLLDKGFLKLFYFSLILFFF